MTLDDLFAFPIVMVDGDNEERKSSMGIGEDGVDIIIGEAECPFYDFISVADRWLPTDDSLSEAIGGNFEACYVTFNNSGSFVVPWTKTRFKKALKKFITTRPQPKSMTLTKDEFRDLFNNDKNDNITEGE